MFICNDLLAELAIQDIISINSARAIEPFFNTFFNIKSMANFYIMGSSSFLTCHHSKERKNSSIEDNISQPANDLAARPKGEIIRHIRSRKIYWIFDDVVTSIHQTIKEKIDIIFKLWQVSAIIDMVYRKKDVVILAGTRSSKSLLY